MQYPWKVIICDSEKCMSEALDAKGGVKEDYKIYPEIDTPEFTQFKCSRCGKIKTWGVTRNNVARILYERATYVRMGR